MRILVTGANGFVGKNLVAALANLRDGKDRRSAFSPLLPLEIYECDIDTTADELRRYCENADFVFNFAGINRPKNTEEFKTGNVGFLDTVLENLKSCGNRCPVMLSSSTQAELSGRFKDSDYGKSKLLAEEHLRDYAESTGARTLIYRFPNLYGKWCRPNYNSAVATFCYNLAHDLPIKVNDPSVELTLLYIDDLVQEMLRALLGEETRREDGFCHAEPTDTVTLGDLADMLVGFQQTRGSLYVPEMTEGSFSKKLYSTFLSYLPPEKFSYKLTPHEDERGSFTEILRTENAGQVSVNISRPGITKGQHWHNTKWEKFCVVAGEGLIRLRPVMASASDSGGIIEFHVSGSDPEVVEMIPGYTHSITNLSQTENLVTVMWCNECFDPENPDTFFLEV